MLAGPRVAIRAALPAGGKPARGQRKASLPKLRARRCLVHLPRGLLRILILLRWTLKPRRTVFYPSVFDVISVPRRTAYIIFFDISRPTLTATLVEGHA